MKGDCLEYYYAAYSACRENTPDWFQPPYPDRSGENSFFVFDLDADRCKYFCSSIKLITGCSSSEYLHKGIMYFKSLIHPNDYSDFISELLTYIFLSREQKEYGAKQGRIKKLSCRIRHKKGHWIQTTFHFLYISKSFGSNINMLIGVIRRNEKEKRKDTSPDHTFCISGREREVLQLIGNGDSSKIIAYFNKP